MKPLPVLLAVALGLATAVSAGPAAIECWFVEDLGGGSLAKRPAALLLRQGPGGPPPRPDLDPKFYLNVHDPTGALQAAFRRYPRDAPAPHCEMSRYVPLPASANWASGLTPEHSCPRALDGAWLMVSTSSSVFSLSSLLRAEPEPRQEPVRITMATGTPTFAVQNQPFEPTRPHPALRRPAEEGLGTPSVYLARQSLPQGPWGRADSLWSPNRGRAWSGRTRRETPCMHRAAADGQVQRRLRPRGRRLAGRARGGSGWILHEWAGSDPVICKGLVFTEEASWDRDFTGTRQTTSAQLLLPGSPQLPLCPPPERETPSVREANSAPTLKLTPAHSSALSPEPPFEPG